MKTRISSFIDNGKTDGSKSIRFFIVFLSSLLLSAISLSFLYVVYNKAIGLVSDNTNLSFDFFFNALSYTVNNYLLGSSMLLSAIFFIFSKNHVRYNKKNMGKHGFKLSFLITLLFFYSFSNNLSSFRLVQNDLYYFLTYTLSSLVMLSSIIIFYLPISTDFKEIMRVLKADSEHNKTMFFIAKASTFTFISLSIAILYTEFYNLHIVTLLALLSLYLLFAARLIFISGVVSFNDLMRLRLELNGFDISAIETRFKSYLSNSLFFSNVKGINNELAKYESNDELFNAIKKINNYLKEHKAQDDIFIFIKKEKSNFTIVDLDGNVVVST